VPVADPDELEDPVDPPVPVLPDVEPLAPVVEVFDAIVPVTSTRLPTFVARLVPPSSM
jgi:hypothetical protein